MDNMFWKHKLKVKPIVFADGLINEFIEKPLYELAQEKQISSEARFAFNLPTFIAPSVLA
jgi:hypothetical protein